METIQANWLVFGLALLAVVLVGWWLFGRASKAPPRQHKPDVLDEGAAPAQRNQALIDAAPAAQIIPPPMAGSMAGLGETIAVAAQDEVEEVVARAATPPPAPPPPPPSPEVAPEPEPEPAPEPQPEVEPVQEPAPEIEPEIEPKPEPESEPQIEPAPVQEPETEAAPQPAPASIQSAASSADDLSRIKGLGPKLQALLPELGITTFAQIATMTEADLAELDTKLGPFAGRPVRDGWVEQAGYLANNDVAGFEARFGKV